MRNFFTDIEGPVRFYAVNTTLTVALLWGAALLFAVCVVCTEGLPDAAQPRWFYLSQVLMFAFLGFDDRFQFHEWAGDWLGIGDHFILLGTATLEAALLLTLGDRPLLRSRAGTNLCLGSVFFAVMVFIDARIPHDLLLRLSLEDLSKTWSTLFFFLFAWETCMERIRRLRAAAA